MSVTAKSARCDVVAHYESVMGCPPAESWSRKLILDNLKAGIAPRSGKAKAALTAKYVKEVGFEPAKTWTAAQIVAKTASKTPPRHCRTVLTVVELRAWATKVGLKGRSKMNKPELLVAYEAAQVEAAKAA